MPNPHHPHYPNHKWIINNEKVRTIQEIGERIQKIGTLLKEKGEIKLDDVEISPPPSCNFILRYERMPRGELSLKIELIWWENNENSPSSDDIEIS